MRSFPSPLLVVVALLLAAADPAAAETSQVPYTSSPLKLADGIDQFGADAQLFQLTSQTSDNSATFYGLWDNQYLYFGVEVTDAALHCAALPPDASFAWDQDGVELHFDLKQKKTLAPGDQDFRQWIFPLNYENNPYDAYGSGETGDPSFTGSATVAVTLSGTLNDAQADTGYSMVIRVPWSDLALTPTDGLTFGFDGAVNDRDSSGEGETTFMDWANLSTYAQPGRWNALQLTGGGGGGGSDAGSSSDAQTASTDAGGDSGATGRPRESVGCTCRVEAGARSLAAPLLVALGILLSALCRRRRAR